MELFSRISMMTAVIVSIAMTLPISIEAQVKSTQQKTEPTTLTFFNLEALELAHKSGELKHLPGKIKIQLSNASVGGEYLLAYSTTEGKTMTTKDLNDLVSQRAASVCNAVGQELDKVETREIFNKKMSLL